MTFSYASVVDRIYSRRASDLYDDIAYLHHPSGVTVIVLRKTPESEVISVDFGSTKKHGVDRSEKTVVGKGKKGGVVLQPETKLCVIKCKDDSEIIVRAGVRGTLVELNDRLKTHPDLVRTAPENQGYIAVVTYGAGKRDTDGFGEALPQKRLCLKRLEEETTKVDSVKVKEETTEVDSVKVKEETTEVDSVKFKEETTEVDSVKVKEETTEVDSVKVKEETTEVDSVKVEEDGVKREIC